MDSPPRPRTLPELKSEFNGLARDARQLPLAQEYEFWLHVVQDIRHADPKPTRRLDG